MKLRSILKIHFNSEMLEAMGISSSQEWVDKFIADAESSGAKVTKSDGDGLETVAEMSLMECYKAVQKLDTDIGALNQHVKTEFLSDPKGLDEETLEMVQNGMMRREEVETDSPTEERVIRLVIGSPKMPGV